MERHNRTRGKLHFLRSSTNLCKHKRGVVFEEDLTVADSGERGGAAAEGALAGLLRCGVDSLPASVAWRQIWTSHPAVGPHVEVPSGNGIKVGVSVLGYHVLKVRGGSKSR